MLLIYLIVNYLYRKYGVPLHNFFKNWTRGISHLKATVATDILDHDGNERCAVQRMKNKIEVPRDVPNSKGP